MFNIEIQKIMRVKAKNLTKILIRRREQFVRAFIAKYKCEPEEVIINEQPSFFDKESNSFISRWWLTHKDDRCIHHCAICDAEVKENE